MNVNLVSVTCTLTPLHSYTYILTLLNSYIHCYTPKSLHSNTCTLTLLHSYTFTLFNNKIEQLALILANSFIIKGAGGGVFMKIFRKRLFDRGGQYLPDAFSPTEKYFS